MNNDTMNTILELFEVLQVVAACAILLTAIIMGLSAIGENQSGWKGIVSILFYIFFFFLTGIIK